MMKIAICDDNENDRTKIKECCDLYFKRKGLKYELYEFASGDSLWKIDFPDVLFMNASLRGMDGLLIKEILELKKAKTKILFVANETNRMQEAFGKNVYGFLNKPLKEAKLNEKLEQMVEDVMDERFVIYCKNGNEIEKVYLRDVIYIESYGRYTKLFIRDEMDYKLSDKCIGDWCEEAETYGFAACHRCYVVNLKYVHNVTSSLELMSGVLLPIGERKKEGFYKAYREFIWRKSYGENDERVLQESGEKYV